MSYATKLIEKILYEYNGGDKYLAFMDLLETKPIWFPEKAKVDLSQSNRKQICCILDDSFPMTDSALNSFKKQIKEKAGEYFDNVTIVDTNDGFNLLIN